MCLQCSGPKEETQSFADIAAQPEFDNGKEPSRWLSILAPVITSKVEAGASRSVPNFLPARRFPFCRRCVKWRGRISSEQGWGCFSDGERGGGFFLVVVVRVFQAEGIVFLAWGYCKLGCLSQRRGLGMVFPIV